MRVADWLAVACLSVALVLLPMALFSPGSGQSERLTRFDVTLKDGSKTRTEGLDGYQTTHAGGLCFAGRDRELSVCFAPGEWTKVDVAK